MHHSLIYNIIIINVIITQINVLLPKTKQNKACKNLRRLHLHNLHITKYTKFNSSIRIDL